MNFERGQDPLKAMGIGSFIYDNGFGPKYYLCNECYGHKLIRKHPGGFQPPYYICHDCGAIVYAPIWVDLDPKTLKPIDVESLPERYKRKF